MERSPTLLSPPQFVHHPVPQQLGCGENVAADVGYASLAEKTYQQSTPWTVPHTGVPSLTVPDVANKTLGPWKQMSLPDSSSILQQGAFRGLMPNAVLQSDFPAKSVFDGSAAVSSVQQLTYVGLPQSRDALATVVGPTNVAQMQPSCGAYCYGQEEFAPPNSALAQQHRLPAPQHPAPVVEILRPTQLGPLTTMPLNDPPELLSTRLPVDQQPVRLLLQPPPIPPQPPLILTSGQPSNLPVAFGAAMPVVPEAPSVELHPVPMLPVPSHIMVEPPALSVRMQEIPQPGFVTQPSPMKLQSSPVVGLFPSFPPASTLQSQSAPRMILQEVSNPPLGLVRPPPALAPAGSMVVRPQHSLTNIRVGQIRPHAMPESLRDLDCRSAELRHLPAAELMHEVAEVQPAFEPPLNTDLRPQNTPEMLSAQLHAEYPGSPRILSNRTMQQQSDRAFIMPTKPLMAPGQMLEALQVHPSSQVTHLPGEPSREPLRLGMSQVRLSELRSHELTRLPSVTQERGDLSIDETLGRLEQRDMPFSGSTFSSRLPAPAVVMASSQIIGSRLPSDSRFQSEFRCRDFAGQQDSGLLLDRPIGTSMDRVRPLNQFASAPPRDASLHCLPSASSRVPSLLDKNLLNLAHGSSSHMDGRPSVPPVRRWKDRPGSGTLTVGELKAALRQQDDHSRRRQAFQRSSADEDAAAECSYEPPSKLTRCAEDSPAAATDKPEPKVEPPGSTDSECRDQKGTASATVEPSSSTVTETTSSANVSAQ